MNRSSKLYAAGISVVGLSLGAYCTADYFRRILSSPQRPSELRQLFILWLLYLVCQCFPIVISDNCAIDMSFICDLAAVLSKGPEAAAALVLLSTPFMVKRSGKDNKKLIHIFNTPPIKTMFNASDFIITLFVSGTIYQKLGGPVGALSVQKFILPGIALVFCIIILNSSILMFLFFLSKKAPFFPSLLKNVVDFLPNMAAAAPIGFFLANFMNMAGGEYMALLFMLPLLLARYSFVLYLDVKNNYYNMLQTLSATLEAKDPYTEGHSHMVEIYSEKIAQRLGLSSRRIEEIKVGALLHDIGKIGIDDSILNKPNRLTEKEYQAIMQHPQIGNDILKNVKLSNITHEIILHHHERYDGNGYPSHTKGDELPIDVYIVSAADAFDAMTSKRPYCKNRTPQQALEVLKEESGKQFHPKVVEAFAKVFCEEPALMGQKG